MAYENDALEIQKKNDESRKLIDQMISFMNNKRGYNSSNNTFSIGEDADGRPVLELGDVVTPEEDLYNFNGKTWKYGAFYLDKDYPVMGLYTSDNEFIPTTNKIMKHEIVEYRSPQQLANAIQASNASVDGTKVSYKGDGDGTIQIEGVINHIDLPTTDLKFDIDSSGNPYIYSTIYHDRKFKVELIKSQDKDINNIGGVGTGESIYSYVANKRLERTPIMENNENQPLESNGGNIMTYGKSLFNFYEMRDVYNNYILSAKNEVFRKASDDQTRVLNTIKVDNNKIHAQLKVANLWAKAYAHAQGGETVNGNENTHEDSGSAMRFDHIMNRMSQCENMDLTDVAYLLYKQFGKEDRLLVDSIIYFLANPEISNIYDIHVNMTPESIIASIEKEADAPVMEMKKPDKYS